MRISLILHTPENLSPQFPRVLIKTDSGQLIEEDVTSDEVPLWFALVQHKMQSHGGVCVQINSQRP
jgi:hypothetical protein